jgi:hypothetical protein
MKVMAELNKLTYEVQHSPNCKEPFLVRLIARGNAILDRKPHQQTKDICGYGKTLRQAAEKALKKKSQQPNPYSAFRQLERMFPGISEPTPFPRD